MLWLPFVERALAALGTAVEELQLAEANVLIARHYPSLSTDRPALIGPLADAVQCARLGRRLGQAYPDTHPVTVIDGVDGQSPTVQPLSLGQLGRAALGEGISLLYVPPLPCVGSVESFQATVAHLRAPDGCPWDRQQNHRSLRQGFQEEAYEVLDALDRGDVELLKEELGDVMLHVLLQAQIASELGEFRMSDVICHVNDKIVRRHPHVFDGLAVDGVEQVLVNWEEIKRQEKVERAEAPSTFEAISLAMPALARAQSILHRAARLEIASAPVGDLVAHISGALAKLSVEEDRLAKEMLLGDLLFDLAKLFSKLDIDAEGALRDANLRFERRFQESQDTRRGV